MTIDRREGSYKITIWKERPRWVGEWKSVGESVLVFDYLPSWGVKVDHILFVLKNNEWVEDGLAEGDVNLLGELVLS